VHAMLLGARHVPQRLCGGPCLQRGAVTSVQPLPLQPTNQTAQFWSHASVQLSGTSFLSV